MPDPLLGYHYHAQCPPPREHRPLRRLRREPAVGEFVRPAEIGEGLQNLPHARLAGAGEGWGRSQQPCEPYT